MELRSVIISGRKLIKRRKRQIRLIKIFVCILLPCTVIIMSTFVSFANIDVKASLTDWYNKKFDESKSVIEKALNTELAVQKTKLETEIQQALVASNKDLDEYTINEKEKSLKKLIDYANTLSNTMNISNDSDKKQIESKLISIIDSAKLAMENLKESYIPPVETFTPKKVDITQVIGTGQQPETTSQPNTTVQQTAETKQHENTKQVIGTGQQPETASEPDTTVQQTAETKQPEIITQVIGTGQQPETTSQPGATLQQTAENEQPETASQVIGTTDNLSTSQPVSSTIVTVDKIINNENKSSNSISGNTP